jgi:2-methylcitrate dehydratase PrpD
MYAVEIFAEFITNASRRHDDYAIGVSRNALTDTIACIYAGIDRPIAISTLQAFEVWGPGDATVIARQASLIPPFAALVNAATAHALDYDDFDTAANSHPSAVIFPALFGMATTGDTTGYDILAAPRRIHEHGALSSWLVDDSHTG